MYKLRTFAVQLSNLCTKYYEGDDLFTSLPPHNARTELNRFRAFYVIGRQPTTSSGPKPKPTQAATYKQNEAGEHKRRV